MISELMNVMVERSPQKARKIQKSGKGELEAFVTSIARKALQEAQLQNVPKHDLNRQQMVREIAFQNALDEVLSDTP